MDFKTTIQSENAALQCTKINTFGVAGLEYGHTVYGTASNAICSVRLPQLAVVGVVPTIGEVKPNEPSPIDEACMAFYTYIRSMNASISAFQSPDVGKYLIAMSNLYALFAEAERTLYMFSKVKRNNVLYPTILSKWAKTYNVTPDNIVVQANRLELIRKQILKFAMPSKFPLVTQYVGLLSTMFADDDLEKSAIVAFSLKKVLHWDINNANSPTIGALLYEDVTPGTIFEKLEFLLSEYMLDEDVNRISAEIQKAYGGKDLLGLAPVELDKILASDWALTFDFDLVDSVHNAFFIFGTRELHQSNETLVAGIQEDAQTNLKYGVSTANNKGIGALTFKTTGYYNAYPGKEISLPINTHGDNPSGASIYAAILLHPSFSFGSNDGQITATPHGFGFVLPCSYSMYSIGENSTQEWSYMTLVDTFVDQYEGPVTQTFGDDNLKAWKESLSASPMLWGAKLTNAGATTGNSQPVLGDIDNIVIIPQDYATIIFRWAMLDAFDINKLVASVGK